MSSPNNRSSLTEYEMGVQEDVENSSSSQVEIAKDTLGHDDKGELGSVPILKYHRDILPSGDDQIEFHTMMRQYGWIALWTLMATSGTLSTR